MVDPIHWIMEPHDPTKQYKEGDIVSVPLYYLCPELDMSVGEAWHIATKDVPADVEPERRKEYWNILAVSEPVVGEGLTRPAMMYRTDAVYDPKHRYLKDDSVEMDVSLIPGFENETTYKTMWCVAKTDVPAGVPKEQHSMYWTVFSGGQVREDPDKPMAMLLHDPNVMHPQGRVVYSPEEAGSYWAKVNVPKGIPITDERYWESLFRRNSNDKPFERPPKPRVPVVRYMLVILGIILVVCALTTGTMMLFGTHKEIILYAAVLAGVSIRYAVLRLLGGLEKPVGHTHTNDKGVLVKCYHQCISVMRQPGFWIGMTLGYPFEHFLWEKVWPFSVIHDLLGL